MTDRPTPATSGTWHPGRELPENHLECASSARNGIAMRADNSRPLTELRTNISRTNNFTLEVTPSGLAKRLWVPIF